jgi:superfamily II DNA/RNA helicase
MSYSYRSSRTSFKSRANKPRYSSKNNRRGDGKSIDPRRFVAAAAPREVEAYTSQFSFADFALHDILQTNLAAKGYEAPSPIQDQAIPVGLQGHDVVGMASTGTGKTAAFALPVLQRLLSDKHSSALIIAPTRELAQQIEAECRALGKGSGINGALLVGGTAMGGQLRDLRGRPQIVIGTPGRIKDHLMRGTLKLDAFNVVVLDEVDRMLDMGFINDIRTIIGKTSPKRQSLFFSATVSSDIRRLIDDFTHEPVTITIQAAKASENVHQDVVRYSGNTEKLDQLHDLLIRQEVSKAIVFDETQRGVERLSKELLARGFSTDSMHGGKTQGQRQRALSKFKNSEINVLVATDVAARGIDVADISHVINYSTPKEYDEYVHRIGRAGRAGRIGYAFTFVPR